MQRHFARHRIRLRQAIKDPHLNSTPFSTPTLWRPVTHYEEHVSDNELLSNEEPNPSSVPHYTKKYWATRPIRTMQNPSRVHHARNTSSDTEFVSNRQQRSSSLRLATIPKIPIEDANIANTDDANSLMLHSANIRIEQSNQRFSSLHTDTRLKQRRMPMWLMWTLDDGSPFELTRPHETHI